MTDTEVIVKALETRKLYWEVLGEPSGVVPSAGSLAAWIAVVQHLTDTMPAATLAPRTWNFGDEIPGDVNTVLLANGQYAYRFIVQGSYGTWSYELPGNQQRVDGWHCFHDIEYPVTEVVE